MRKFTPFAITNPWFNSQVRYCEERSEVAISAINLFWNNFLTVTKRENPLTLKQRLQRQGNL